MNAQHIIEKYYNRNTQLYRILMEHSHAVMEKAVEIAKHYSGANIEFIRQAALIHDIGIFLTDAPEIKCFGAYPYISHGYLGRELIEKEGFITHALVCERHTGVGLSKEYIIENNLPIPHRNMVPVSTEEQIICYADKFFSKSAKELGKEKSMDAVIKSITKYGKENAAIFMEWHRMFY